MLMMLLLLARRNLHKKSSEVSIKTRSRPCTLTSVFHSKARQISTHVQNSTLLMSLGTGAIKGWWRSCENSKHNREVPWKWELALQAATNQYHHTEGTSVKNLPELDTCSNLIPMRSVKGWDLNWPNYKATKAVIHKDQQSKQIYDQSSDHIYSLLIRLDDVKTDSFLIFFFFFHIAGVCKWRWTFWNLLWTLCSRRASSCSSVQLHPWKPVCHQNNNHVNLFIFCLLPNCHVSLI